MKIIICGSLKAKDEIISVKESLEKMGNTVEFPSGVKLNLYQGRKDVPTSEKAEDKIKNDVIKDYYNKIKEYNAVLIVNPELNGIKGYIGGNTLMEMGFAHVLDKPLYCLYSVPDMSYTPEILAMQPIILDGDLRIFS